MVAVIPFIPDAEDMRIIQWTLISCLQYAILRVEGARQRLPPAGPAMRSLTDLSSPRIDWVALAKGMGVPGVKVETCQELREALERAILERQNPQGETSRGKGPFLIQACI
jgi:hypothetical protein